MSCSSFPASSAWSGPARSTLYPLKTLVPVGAFLLLLQGIAEVFRCIRCIRDGQWPQRLHDVEELEKQIIEQHQRDAGRSLA